MSATKRLNTLETNPSTVPGSDVTDLSLVTVASSEISDPETRLRHAHLHLLLHGRSQLARDLFEIRKANIDSTAGSSVEKLEQDFYPGRKMSGVSPNGHVRIVGSDQNLNAPPFPESDITIINENGIPTLTSHQLLEYVSISDIEAMGF